MHILMFIN